jgi:dTDP-4-amino-4,6-dideoxygalactose transaminase
MGRIPYIDLQAQYDSIRTEVLRGLGEICESGRFAQGPARSDFESQFAGYCGVDHCVGLNSGTSALHLALRCLGVGPRDEVVTVSMTFIATA